MELLENVGGIAERISKLKPYRGKGIVITGPINVTNYKNIGPLTGVVEIRPDGFYLYLGNYRDELASFLVKEK